MGSMFVSATSGLLAAQRALDTTSHNISNVNTLGYSRQSVLFDTRQPSAYSNGFVGNGVDVTTVRRAYDQFVAMELRSTSSTLSRLDAYGTQASSVNNLFGDTATGLTAALQQFINSLQDVAGSPSSIPARQVVLSQAQSFAGRLSSYNDRLTALDANVNDQLAREADTINALGRNIAELNQRIETAQVRTGQPPNDLLDQRDHLLDELASHVNVQVATQDNGSLIVSIGAGQPLVVGSSSATLATAADPYDPTRNILTLQNSGATVDITGRLSGGTIGGLLDFRRDMLEPTRNTLGRISIALAETFNAQQADGIDLNGNFGTDLFEVGGVETFSRISNSLTGAISVTRQTPSAGALTDADYYMEYTTSGWGLRRSDTGVAVTMTGAGTALSPYQADGIDIVVTGAPVVGDSFLIRPTRAAVEGMRTLIDDPAEIAAAAPIMTSTSGANIGSGRISLGEVTDVTNAALQTTVNLVFDSATTYQVNGAGASIPYTAGSNIDINGWRVTINGAPGIGDTFTIAANNSPAGDNRNALRLSAVLSERVLDGGTVNINDATSRLTGRIGVLTNSAQTTRAAQQSIYDDAVSARDSVSGVNLDEEAANLLRFQQAYQAAAQVISVANSLFDSVLQAVRR
jgi:flagellar hook-associated protein 1 FlgK